MHMVQASVQHLRWVQKEDVSQVQAPALIIIGEGDKITRAEWAQASADSRSCLFETCAPRSLPELVTSHSLSAPAFSSHYRLLRTRSHEAERSTSSRTLATRHEYHHHAFDQRRHTPEEGAASAAALGAIIASWLRLHPTGFRCLLPQVMLETPDEVNALMDAFLERVLPAETAVGAGGGL